MATFGVSQHFKGGTQEQYENAVKVVHPPGGLPAGQTLHIGGNTPDGFLVIALFDSENAWTTFRDETLLPGLATAEGAFGGPPEETTFEVVTVQTA
jgi:hypothetical protein